MAMKGSTCSADRKWSYLHLHNTMWKFIPMFYPIGSSKGVLFHQRDGRGTSVGVVGYPCFIQGGGRGVVLFVPQYVQQLRIQKRLKALLRPYHLFTEWQEQ